MLVGGGGDSKFHHLFMLGITKFQVSKMGGSKNSHRMRFTTLIFTKSGKKKISPPIRVWWAGYEATLKAGIKSSQPEVKASKSVKRFQRYWQLKFNMFLPLWPVVVCECTAAYRRRFSRLLTILQTTLLMH